jgi:hypothetical protein
VYVLFDLCRYDTATIVSHTLNPIISFSLYCHIDDIDEDEDDEVPVINVNPLLALTLNIPS